MLAEERRKIQKFTVPSNRSGVLRSAVASVEKRSIAVFTEGVKTEPRYLQFWQRRFRRSVVVTLGDIHGDPLTIVRAASDLRIEELKEEKRGRGKAHDEYWCAFDRDEHASFADAINFAQSHGISLALSNPCIELWFVLHFADQTASIHRHDAQSLSQGHLACGKDPTDKALELLGDRFDDAKRRAAGLEAMHSRNGTGPFGDPSSTMCQLVDSIKGT